MSKEKELKFEDTISKLEVLVQELESGDLNLEDSIKKFEQGMELSKKCNEFLEEAEKKINILIKQDDGSILEEKFDK